MVMHADKCTLTHIRKVKSNTHKLTNTQINTHTHTHT